MARALCPTALFDGRARGLLAVGVVTAVAGGAGTSVASEPDQEREGLGAPDQGVLVAPEPPAPSVDPLGGQTGGGETVLPDDTAPPPPDPGPAPVGGEGEAEDWTPVEDQPADDPYGRLVLTAPDAPAAPAPLNDDPSAALPDTSTPPALEAPTPPVPQQDGQLEAAPAPADPEPVSDRRPVARERARERERRAPREDAPGVPAPTTAVTPPAAAPAPPSYVAPVTESRAPVEIKGRFHVVRRGESLWSIATALLGRDASPADIVKRVARLWRLNEHRIGTGDPSLLPVGVRLRLR